MTVINFDDENFGSIIVIVVQNIQCNKFENLQCSFTVHVHGRTGVL